MLDHDYLKYYKIEKDGVILDLGATSGEFSLENERQLIENNCTVINVEPSLWVISKLISVIEKIPNSVLITSATGKENSIQEFSITSAHILNCLKSHNENISIWGGREVKTELVSVLALDTILNMFPEVDFLKCDIEGGEIDTFLSSKCIRKVKNLAIASYHIVNGEETYLTLRPFFEKNGYKVIHEKISFMNFLPQSMLYCMRIDNV